MPGPLFTSNPSDYNKLERLYVTETAPTGSITGTNRNIVGIAGACVRGPVNRAIEVSSFKRFTEIFGGRDYTADGSGTTIIGEVWKARINKPFGTIVVVRAAAAAAVAASFTLETVAGGSGTAVLRVDASSVGVWGNDVSVKVESPTNGSAGYFNLRVKYLGATKLYENLTIASAGVDNTLSVLGDDDGNWITLNKLADGTPVTTGMSGLDTDGYINLGETVVSFTSVAGADGTIADTDYTGTDKAIEKLAGAPRVACCLVAERSNDTINAKIKTVAATANDRMWLVWNGTLAITEATAITDVADYRGDRLVYCHNDAYTLDPDSGTEIATPATHWMAAIFANTPSNRHVGSFANRSILAGITRLARSPAAGDYESLKAAGICALEAVRSGGFVFVSGCTTSLTPGLTEIARRRSADELILAAVEKLQYYVKEDNTEEVRAAIAADLIGYSNSMRKKREIVEEFEVDQDSVNSDEERAAGREYVLWRVKMIGHVLALILKFEGGTAVEIEN